MHKETRGTQVKGTKRMKTQVALRVHEDVTVSDTNGSGYMRMLAERALYNWLDVCVRVCVCVRERERECACLCV